MSFAVHPEIASYNTVAEFFAAIDLSAKDLIVTNKYILEPYMALADKAGCGKVYTEEFGTTEPTNKMINDIMKAVAGKGYTRVIGIGGGAVMDISKQLIFDDSLTVEDLYRLKPDLCKKRALIEVPTTCGTGSEVTNISVALFPDQHSKIGLVSPALFPDQAVLVPELLKTIPYDVFAASSIDALIHAVESYVSPKHDVFSRVFSEQGIRRIIKGYRKMTEENVPFTDMLDEFGYASCMAGIAFSNAGCGGVHALSFPLGGSFFVPHGKANYYLFEALFRMYKEKGADMSDLEAELDACLAGSGDVFTRLFDLLAKILECKKIHEVGVTDKDIDIFIPAVIANQQRLLVNMPVSLDEADMKDVYTRCL